MLRRQSAAKSRPSISIELQALNVQTLAVVVDQHAHVAVAGQLALAVVVNAGFGGTCGDGTLTYDYKYTEDKNNVYVYSSFAYVKNCPYEVYKDLEMKDKYEAEESFELNNDNYKDFNKYKITYKKDKSNYIFDSIKVLK